MNKKYEEYVEEKTETREINTKRGKLVIEYKHMPNVVKRSQYTGLPVWIGKTEATGTLNGGTAIDTEAKCWAHEPWDFSRARVVTTGRILKQLNLPTCWADLVKGD